MSLWYLQRPFSRIVSVPQVPGSLDSRGRCAGGRMRLQSPDRILDPVSGLCSRWLRMSARDRVERRAHREGTYHSTMLAEYAWRTRTPNTSHTWSSQPGSVWTHGIPRSSDRTYLDPPDWRDRSQPRACCSNSSLPGWSLGCHVYAGVSGLCRQKSPKIHCICVSTTCSTLSAQPSAGEPGNLPSS